MNVLAFFAHPDDETMLAGGTLALLAHSGAKVYFVSATRGEGGELGEPPRCREGELGYLREMELISAVRVLGGSSLTCLGYTDPEVGPGNELYPFTSNLAMLSGQLAARMRQYHIDAVITHGSNGEYGHPAHILCHQAARLAVSSFPIKSVLLYTVAADYPKHPYPRTANQHDPAHLVLDITPVLRYKVMAALCHRTQHALFVRRSSRQAGRKMKVPEVLLSVESLHRVLPPVENYPQDLMAESLRPWVLEWNR